MLLLKGHILSTLEAAVWENGGEKTTVYLISAKQGCKINYLFPLTELE